MVFGVLPLGKYIGYADDLELIGNDSGLVIEPESSKLFDLSNLNPGDSQEAKITIRNDYEEAFQLFMRAERVDVLLGENEPDLLGQLESTIYLGEDQIYEGSISDFAMGILDLGKFESGNELELRAVVHLPGPETGNEFQGSSAEVKWQFIAQADQTLGEEDPENDEPREQTLGEEDPGPSLPRTGERAGVIYFIIGATLLILGLFSIVREKMAR